MQLRAVALVALFAFGAAAAPKPNVRHHEGVKSMVSGRGDDTESSTWDSYVGPMHSTVHYDDLDAAAGPAGPGVEVNTVTVELANVNYYDLTATEDGDRFVNTSSVVGHIKDMTMPVPGAPTVMDKVGKAVADGMEAVVKVFAVSGGPAGAPSAAAASPAPALLLLSRGSAAPAPASGPAPAPAAKKPSGPSATCDIHANVAAAKPLRAPATAAHPLFMSPKSTQITANIVGQKCDGVGNIKATLQAAKKNGALEMAIKRKIKNETGIDVVLGSISISQTMVQQWSQNICIPHMTKVVKEFSNAYTRNQVPNALFNECTNFWAKASFSSDHVLNVADQQQCREASLKFEKLWKFGQGLTGLKLYEPVCLIICEKKFGKGAPQCHVEMGDQLAPYALA